MADPAIAWPGQTRPADVVACREHARRRQSRPAALNRFAPDFIGVFPFIIMIAVLDALLGMSLGLFASAFARTEFQAVQFMLAFVLPQTLLCGIVVARGQMTDVLRWLSDVLPLSYAVDAMQQISSGASWSSTVTRDIGVICAFTIGALIGGALTLRRRTK